MRAKCWTKAKKSHIYAHTKVESLPMLLDSSLIFKAEVTCPRSSKSSPDQRFLPSCIIHKSIADLYMQVAITRARLPAFT